MALRCSEPSTRQSTFGMPTSRAAGLSASMAPDATKFRSRRSFTKNRRSHCRIDSVGASNPYLPATPWNIWIRAAPRGSVAHMKSDVR
jgi:hypothetical protein